MNRINWVQARSISVYTIMILSFSLVGCAYMPDNYLTKEVVNTEAISQMKIKKVGLLDVPIPTDIWLGKPGGVAVGFINPLISLAGATHESHTITSSEKFSEVTRDEMRNWLEEAGIEVILLKAKRVKKSKMLKNYDQFKDVDVDAILEIAPGRVGFMEELGKVHFTEGELSPDVALTYRLITPGDNQILIESNVFYSSFRGQYITWTGINLLGPKEHIFEDSDSVKDQPEEAARRLKHAISGATESIAQVVTNTRPSFSFIKPSGVIDLTGVYRVRIRREDRQSYGCWGGKRSFEILLEQTNSNQAGTYGSVEGAFLSGLGGRIKGTLSNNRVNYSFATKICDQTLYGAWELKPDGLSLEGYGWKAVKWKLKKLQ